MTSPFKSTSNRFKQQIGLAPPTKFQFEKYDKHNWKRGVTISNSKIDRSLTHGMRPQSPDRVGFSSDCGPSIAKQVATSPITFSSAFHSKAKKGLQEPIMPYSRPLGPGSYHKPVEWIKSPTRKQPTKEKIEVFTRIPQLLSPRDGGDDDKFFNHNYLSPPKRLIHQIKAKEQTDPSFWMKSDFNDIIEGGKQVISPSRLKPSDSVPGFKSVRIDVNGFSRLN
eukprot:TRINITY_DN6839_c0_g1_i1.p1 TRINITY_DN6839_c0_g1~~TRINITY_DN6839_c0_g1_i1.p1  ORF type:complete len:246 (+),score=40.71 TRINITY_DN6839_c0_g1_i1:70-738(+)